jgi:phosphate uptake regulator
MSEKHLSTQFDTELSGISTRVLEMGGLVESQVAQAVYALTNFSGDVATEVLRNEERVNAMESRSTAICRPSLRGASQRARSAPVDCHLQDDREPGACGRRSRTHCAYGAAVDQHRRVEPPAPAGE